MPEFGEESKKNLSTCHQDLQRLFNEVIKDFDCKVICGHRGKEEQNKAFADGFSHVKWPNGRHNKLPSLAADVVPYPVDWEDEKKFMALSEVVKCKASELGINVTWGGDWGAIFNGKPDYPHWEVKGA